MNASAKQNLRETEKQKPVEVEKLSVVAPDAVHPDRRIKDREQAKREGRDPRHDEPIGGG